MDFEFRAPDGERPEPLCMVARELRGGRLLELWADELRACASPPFDVGPDAPVRRLLRQRRAGLLPGARLADAGAHPRPVRRVPRRHQRQAGRPWRLGADRRGAVARPRRAWPPTRRPRCAALVLRGGPYTADERRAVLDYCRADVDTLAALLPRMLPELLGRQRGRPRRPRARAAAGALHGGGGPHGADRHPDRRRAARPHPGRLGRHQARAGRRGRRRFGVYDGLSFRADRFAAYLAAHGIPWPRLASGALALDDDTFRDMAKAVPAAPAAARAAARAGRVAPRGAGGRAGRPQPLPALAPSARGPAATSRATRGSCSARRPGSAA